MKWMWSEQGAGPGMGYNLSRGVRHNKMQSHDEVVAVVFSPGRLSIAFFAPSLARTALERREGRGGTAAGLIDAELAVASANNVPVPDFRARPALTVPFPGPALFLSRLRLIKGLGRFSSSSKSYTGAGGRGMSAGFVVVLELALELLLQTGMDVGMLDIVAEEGNIGRLVDDTVERRVGRGS